LNMEHGLFDHNWHKGISTIISLNIWLTCSNEISKMWNE
jgi:hypothetical protein